MREEITREDYLNKAVDELAYLFDNAGYELPRVNVSCSWPGGGSPNKRIGECWPKSRSGADINEIFISPSIEDSVKVLGILTHELAHAVDDCVHGHKGPFVKIIRAVGLEGKPTVAIGGEKVEQEFKEIIKHLGEYPHKKLQPGGPKQSNRQMKVECTNCGAIFRMSRKWQDEVEQCPCCSGDRYDLDFE